MEFAFAQSLSCMKPFVTAWTLVRQALCPWDFPGKNRVGYHFILHNMKFKEIHINTKIRNIFNIMIHLQFVSYRSDHLNICLIQIQLHY